MLFFSRFLRIFYLPYPVIFFPFSSHRFSSVKSSRKIPLPISLFFCFFLSSRSVSDATPPPSLFLMIHPQKQKSKQNCNLLYHDFPVFCYISRWVSLLHIALSFLFSGRHSLSSLKTLIEQIIFLCLLHLVLSAPRNLRQMPYHSKNAFLFPICSLKLGLHPIAHLLPFSCCPRLTRFHLRSIKQPYTKAPFYFHSLISVCFL